ncbi:hypothetical protein B0T22DRAFT_468467 [Podospora appendiculata]|uniref:Uncharacterized protein n=1 Tax=Podospora appendiculata TaxID=314037 RepID=A0AAE1C8Z5_9PEZI|nr:hypothetical protein B0T22DRAFT_468467 [Podospora appendiculata]
MGSLAAYFGARYFGTGGFSLNFVAMWEILVGCLGLFALQVPDSTLSLLGVWMHQLGGECLVGVLFSFARCHAE